MRIDDLNTHHYFIFAQTLPTLEPLTRLILLFYTLQEMRIILENFPSVRYPLVLPSERLFPSAYKYLTLASVTLMANVKFQLRTLA